jgi:glycosyltransferase involved in cell wall biosynthesis
MSSPTLVSVILPTCNRAGFLKGSIESVLAQTHKQWKLLVVDDVSSDHTREVVQAFDDPRINYLRLESKGGASGARNAGLAQTRGSYVAFLDDDDTWMPTKLEVQLLAFQRGSARLGVVHTNATYVVERADEVYVRARKGGAVIPDGDVLEDLLEANFVVTGSCVVRRECLERIGGFDETIVAASDWDFWLRIAEHYDFHYIDRELYRYRIHGGNVTFDYERQTAGRESILKKYPGRLAVRHSRRSADFHLGLGMMFCATGQTKKGREAYQRAIRLDRSNPRPYLGMALSVLGERGSQHLSRRWADGRMPWSRLNRRFEKR